MDLLVLGMPSCQHPGHQGHLRPQPSLRIPAFRLLRHPSVGNVDRNPGLVHERIHPLRVQLHHLRSSPHVERRTRESSNSRAKLFWLTAGQEPVTIVRSESGETEAQVRRGVRDGGPDGQVLLCLRDDVAVVLLCRDHHVRRSDRLVDEGVQEARERDAVRGPAGYLLLLAAEQDVPALLRLLLPSSSCKGNRLIIQSYTFKLSL